ncbi:MAG: hypothetical protein H6739_39660 [Alphaproteobacteria bacterium]|nr:hypothetical protein [Alphaproteobacteria bacterium]
MRRRFLSDWGGAIRIPTNSKKYLGWLIAEKLIPNMRILEVLHDCPEHSAYKYEASNLTTPYCVHIIELDREVHESGIYEIGDDYRRLDVFRFRTAEEAEDFIKSQGVAMSDLVDPRLVDVP